MSSLIQLYVPPLVISHSEATYIYHFFSAALIATLAIVFQNRLVLNKSISELDAQECEQEIELNTIQKRLIQLELTLDEMRALLVEQKRSTETLSLACELASDAHVKFNPHFTFLEEPILKYLETTPDTSSNIYSHLSKNNLVPFSFFSTGGVNPSFTLQIVTICLYYLLHKGCVKKNSELWYV